MSLLPATSANGEPAEEIFSGGRSSNGSILQEGLLVNSFSNAMIFDS
jgi:hypothetical protein